MHCLLKPQQQSRVIDEVNNKEIYLHMFTFSKHFKKQVEAISMNQNI
jgi:hypothetical protein